MAKVTMVLCDVKPCTGLAEREFEVNGQTLYVCGEQCFARFWSREYGNWKETRYGIRITFHHLTLMQKYEAQDASERKDGVGSRSDWRIVMPR